MTPFQSFVLSLIQGITEYLPVSAAAHTLLLERALAWPTASGPFDVAVNLGAFLAVVVGFRREIAILVRAWLAPATVDKASDFRRLGLAVGLGCLPVMLVAYLFFDEIARTFSNPRVIIGSTLLFAWVMFIADRAVVPSRTLADLGPARGLFIGAVQVLALIPGASRVGIVMMIGRMTGFDNELSARFAYLLSVPILGAAAALGGYRLLGGGAPIDWPAFGLVVGVTALSGWGCIRLFLFALRKIGFLPFILYRMALGVALIYVL